MKDRSDKITPEEQKVREAIRDLGEVRADPAFRERLKRGFVNGDIRGRKAPARPRFFPLPAWQFAALLLAAVGVWLLIRFFPGPSWKIQAVAGKGWITVNDERVDASEPGLLAHLVLPGARVRVGGDVLLDLRGGDALLLELAGGSDVTLPAAPRRWFAKPLECFVHTGELRLRTGPEFAGQRLAVLTAEGTTEITGTTVSVYRGDGFTCVCVLEGTAHVGKDPAHMQAVTAGLRKVMFGGDRPSEVSDIEPHHEEGLRRFEERSARSFP